MDSNQAATSTGDSAAVIDLFAKAKTLSGEYQNIVIARTNDHVLRMSRMSEPYFWHYHPNSDETFIGVEGTVILNWKISA